MTAAGVPGRARPPRSAPAATGPMTTVHLASPPLTHAVGDSRPREEPSIPRTAPHQAPHTALQRTAPRAHHARREHRRSRRRRGPHAFGAGRLPLRPLQIPAALGRQTSRRALRRSSKRVQIPTRAPTHLPARGATDPASGGPQQTRTMLWIGPWYFPLPPRALPPARPGRAQRAKRARSQGRDVPRTAPLLGGSTPMPGFSRSSPTRHHSPPTSSSSEPLSGAGRSPQQLLSSRPSIPHPAYPLRRHSTRHAAGPLRCPLRLAPTPRPGALCARRGGADRGKARAVPASLQQR
jgi:hypothetical protein